MSSPMDGRVGLLTSLPFAGLSFTVLAVLLTSRQTFSGAALYLTNYGRASTRVATAGQRLTMMTFVLPPLCPGYNPSLSTIDLCSIPAQSPRHS